MSQTRLSCVKHTVCKSRHQGALNQNKIKDASSVGWWELLSSLLNDDHGQPNSIWCDSVENDHQENILICLIIHISIREPRETMKLTRTHDQETHSQHIRALKQTEWRNFKV